MNRVAILACVLASGCFYADPINQRPSIGIVQKTEGLIYRGSTVELAARADDPEGHQVSYQWRAYACTSAEPTADGARPGCDRVPFHTEAALDETDFIVPALRSDEAVPPQNVLVLLEGRDDFGAVARPIQQLVLAIDDHAPALALSMRPRNGYVVGTRIELYAKVSDPDDGAASTLPLTWTVYSPMNQPSYELTELDVPDPEAPTFLQLGKTFRPQGEGQWEVEVTATDPLGAATTESLVINVVPDRAPCLAQWAPIAAQSPNALPLTEPSLFQVTVVDDDLDPFPTVPGDPELRATTFSWRILPPGASAWQDLDVDANQLALDPANYAPGDIVELRVEITDRQGVTTTCADSQPTCSVISNPQCIQRQTWRMEVR